MKNLNKQAGISILGILVFGIILILVLSYFHVSIKSIIESPTGQENINYVRGGVKDLWTAYLEKPVNYIWNDIIINFFWKNFFTNIKEIVPRANFLPQ
jgi:hypothetical protein